MIKWKTAALLVMLAAMSACGGEARQAERTLSRERFIETNVALRQIDRAAANADSLREATLAEHGVTEEQLRAFVTARARRPGELSAVWDEIHRRLLEAEAPATLDEQRAAELELPAVPTLQPELPAQPEPELQQSRAAQPDAAGVEQQSPPTRVPARIRRALGRPSLETVQ